jgi:hypothetical protein
MTRRARLDGRLFVAMLFAAGTAGAQPNAGLGAWSSAASQVPPDSSEAACLVTLRDHRILAVGGAAEAEIYDPAKKAWQLAGQMIEPRAGHTATLLQDGRVLVAGGGTRSLEIFDPKTNTWTLTAGQLTEARSRHAAALLANGSVLISGGQDGDAALSSTDLFDPVTGNVTPSGFLTVPRFGHTATTLLDGKVLIAGGEGLASAEIYDPDLQSFSPAGAMTVARAGHIAILLPDNNQVLLAGGRGEDGAALASAEIYTPWTAAFQSAASMATAHADAFVEAGERGTVTVESQGDAEAFHFPTVTATWSGKNDGTIKVDAEGWHPGRASNLFIRPFHRGRRRRRKFQPASCPGQPCRGSFFFLDSARAAMENDSPHQASFQYLDHFTCLWSLRSSERVAGLGDRCGVNSDWYGGSSNYRKPVGIRYSFQQQSHHDHKPGGRTLLDHRRICRQLLPAQYFDSNSMFIRRGHSICRRLL